MAIADSAISLQNSNIHRSYRAWAGVFFSGLIRGAEIIGNSPAVQNVTQEAKEFLDNNIPGVVVVALMFW